jgi:hypothetical protein
MIEQAVEESVPAYSPINVMAIEQAGFGYISPDIRTRFGMDRIETSGLVWCVALVLLDKTKKMSLLAHIDERTANTDCLNDMLDTIGQHSFDGAVAVHATYKEKRTLETVMEFAEKHAVNVERISQVARVGRIGVDLDGRVYVPDGFIVCPSKSRLELESLSFVERLYEDGAKVRLTFVNKKIEEDRARVVLGEELKTVSRDTINTKSRTDLGRLKVRV